MLKRHFIEVDGLRLCYHEDGTGEPLLLLHGYPQNHRCWRYQIPALAEQHRVVAPDWFGWGESERSLDHRPDYDSEVARLETLADALGLERFNLAGHDYGGFLALGFAQRYPHRVRRLAILNSRAHRSFDARFYRVMAATGYAARRPGLRHALAAAPLYALHRREMTRHAPDSFSAAELEGYIGWLKQGAGRQWWVHFFRHYQVRPRADLDAGLADLHCPTAIIWGDADPYCNVAIARDLAARIPHAELTVLPGIGHFSPEHDPQTVLRALYAWLDH